MVNALRAKEVPSGGFVEDNTVFDETLDAVVVGNAFALSRSSSC